MPALVKYEQSQLPTTIEDLQTFLLVGKEQLKAHQAKIRAIDKVPLAHAAKTAALLDAQCLADILLDAEAKLGMMLAAMPLSEKRASSARELATLPPTITKKESHQAQTLARHPEVVEMVKLQAVVKGQLPTAQEVYKEIKKQERQAMHQDKHVQPFPKGKYAVILADPPWKYDNSGFSEAAEGQYPTMSLEEICQLPVPDLATESTILFLWAVNPLIPEALQVLEAWGFTYKTNLAWIKDRGRGKGWFLKSRHELILIGVKGETPHPLERPDSCFEADRGPVHSRKPLKSYEIIELMYSGPKIELFARSNRPGWDSWGNEE
jgi:N6-adenosine-specific RNA methylase IME4